MILGSVRRDTVFAALAYVEGRARRSAPASRAHQSHRQIPPSHDRRCAARPPIVSCFRPQPSQTNFPSASIVGGPVAPDRNREPHVEQSVAGPSGPGARPCVSLFLHAHQAQRQVPPSQKRRWPASAPPVSNVAPHASHVCGPTAAGGRLLGALGVQDPPSAALVALGARADAGTSLFGRRKRPPHGEQSVPEPLGPGFFRPPAALESQPHQSQRHVPAARDARLRGTFRVAAANSSPRNVRVAAAAAPRLVSADCPRRRGGAAARFDIRPGRRYRRRRSAGGS